VLTRDEKEYLEHVMGLEYNALSIYNKPENNFWSDANTNGISAVTLSKSDTYLDLSNPNDYIRYKIALANKDYIADAKIFHFGTLSMTHEGVEAATVEALKIAKENGAIISFDPNLRPPLWSSEEKAKEKIAYGLSQCDVLKISDNEITFMTGEEDLDKGIKMIIDEYKIPLVFATYGPDGSKAYCNGVEAYEAGFLNPNTVETTGAGDTFCASALHHVLKYGLEMNEEQLHELLTFANAAASLVTTKKGALCVMPTVDEVEAYRKEFGR
jgi:fructokinase